MTSSGRFVVEPVDPVQSLDFDLLILHRFTRNGVSGHAGAVQFVPWGGFVAVLARSFSASEARLDREAAPVPEHM